MWRMPNPPTLHAAALLARVRGAAGGRASFPLPDPAHFAALCTAAGREGRLARPEVVCSQGILGTQINAINDRPESQKRRWITWLVSSPQDPFLREIYAAPIATILLAVVLLRWL